MPRSLAAALLLLGTGILAAGPTRSLAAEERLDLTGARVLVSPGLPEALRPFLPEGHAPEPLRWPLPDGPLLLLGLPETDRAALEIGETLGVLAPDEDLAGGYVVSAWHDGRRPVAVILASDPAALYVARFEIEPVLPGEARDRTRDVTSDGGAACSCITGGRRAVRPTWRERALWIRDAPERTDPILGAVAAHANFVWLDTKALDARRVRALARRARHFGIGVAPVVHWAEDAEGLARRAVEAAVDLDADAVVLSTGSSHSDAERVLPALARLSGAGVARVPILTTGRASAAQDGLSRRPGVEAVWTYDLRGRSWDSVRRAAAARSRVHLVETWNEHLHAPPSMPRHGDPTLGADVENLVVPDGPFSEAILARAFDPTATAPPDPVEVLRPFVPHDARDGRDLLARMGGALAAAEPRVVASAPWIPAFADDVRRRALALPAASALAILATVPAAPRIDGVLDDREWAYASRRTFGVVEVLVLGDGRDVYVGARVPSTDPARRTLFARLGDVGVAFFALTAEGCEDDDLVHARATRQGDRLTIEARCQRSMLGGDACPGCVLSISVRDDGDSGAPFRDAWTLVIGR